jgi:hypothetical protein
LEIFRRIAVEYFPPKLGNCPIFKGEATAVGVAPSPNGTPRGRPGHRHIGEHLAGTIRADESATVTELLLIVFR